MRCVMRVGRERERGVAMIAVLITMVMLLAVAGALHTGVIAETQLRGSHARSLAGFYAAEAGINRGMGDYRNIFQSYQYPTGADLAEKTFALGPRTVRYQLTPVTVNAMVTVGAGQPFAGLSAIRNSYTAASRSELAGDVEARIGTQFDVDSIPLFQFLAFYANDLEILPGVNMNLHGPVHTNGMLYLNSNATLTIEDCYPATCPTAIRTVQITAAGTVYRGRKDTSECLGTVRISRLTDQNNNGVLDLQDMPCGGTQTSAQLSTWLGSIRANVPALVVPAPDVISRGAGLYWNNADLRIVLDLFNPSGGLYPIIVQAQDGTKDVAKTDILQQFMTAKPGRIFYNDVPAAGSDADAACTAGNSYCNRVNYDPDFTNNNLVYACADRDLNPPDPACTKIVNETLPDGVTKTARRGGFYSNREHAWVRMLNVNVHDLLAWNRAQAIGNQLFDPSGSPSNGGVVLFLSVAGPGSTGAIPSPRYGARVFGSSDLDFPSGVANPLGLTVVSDQGLYVEGNYNVGTVSKPKQPAALLGDTLNVLSNEWSNWQNVANICRNDCQSRKPLSATNRPASTTTIYSAYVAGVDTTSVGNYNGGLENYMRYHEHWTGQTCYYRGSFVSLGNAQRSNGQWCGTGTTCNIYEAPLRNFDFDTDFQQVQNLPPLTPQVTSVRQILFTENFR